VNRRIGRTIGYQKRPGTKPQQTNKPGFQFGGIKKKFGNAFVWSLVLINVILIASLLQKLLNNRIGVQNDYIEENSLSVVVQNGCGEKGVGVVFSDFLKTKKYDVVSVGNADSFDYERSVLIDPGKKSHKEVEVLAKSLGISSDQILPIQNQNSPGDVTLIIGRDYRSLSSYRKTR
jgi:hypothetical protein